MNLTGEPAIMVEEQLSKPSPLRERAEIDTTLPYDTVKEAVTFFGGLADSKPVFIHAERRACNDMELQSTLHELRRSSKLLESMECAKNQALEELAIQQKILLELNLKRQKALASQNEGVNIPAVFVRTEDQKKSDDAKAIESKHLPRQQEHGPPLACVQKELEKAEREIDALKLELQACADKRVSCLQNFTAGEVSAHQTLENILQLWNEKLESKLLLVADADNVKANAGVVASGEELKSDAKSPKLTIDMVREELERLKMELGNTQLLPSRRALENSTGNLTATTSAENDEIFVHSQAKSDLIQVEADLEKARMAESVAVAKAGLQVEELEDLKAKQKEAADENSVFSATVESLRIKWNIVDTEIEAVKERENVAAAAASALKAELKKIKADVSEALTAEARAKEAIASLTADLQEVSAEADRAKLSKKEAMEDASIAKMAAEQAKAANTTLQLRLQAAYKETEASKASEAMAVAEIQTLTQNTNALVSDSHLNSPQTIETEQYDALHQKLQEAEYQAMMNVSELVELLNAQKATEQELLSKLKEARIEVEASKSAWQEASQKAQIAEADKVAVEGELRKWRAENGRYRQASEAASVASPGPTVSGRSLIPETPERKTPKTDHFAQVLQLKFPHPAGKEAQSAYAKARAKKKLRFFARIKSFFFKKLNKI